MRKLALSTAALVLLAPAVANASGFSTARFGAEHGTPVSTNPTGLYYNPGAMADGPGLRVFVDGTFALRWADFTHTQATTDVAEPAGAEGANNGTATLFNFAAAPMIGATYTLENKLSFGAAFYVPFGGASVWDKNKAFENNASFAGPVDGVQRWHTIEGTLRSMFVTVGAAYRIEEARLSLGVTGNLILSDIDTVRARNADGSNRLGTEGRSWLKASGISGSFGIGALFEVVPKTVWLGASYQSMPGVTGGTALDGKLTNKFGPGEPTVQDVTVYQGLPDVFRFGVRGRPRDWLEFRLFGDISRWSAFKNQCIAPKGEKCAVSDKDGGAIEETAPVQNVVRKWQDAFGVRAGASFYPSDKAEVMVGVGYDGNAIPDATLDPSLTDFEDVSLSLGGRFQIMKQVGASLTYTHILYAPRNTTNKSSVATNVAPSNGPDAGGAYTQTIGVINANVDLRF
ncbi:MAG: outer membrane protein transport protein [Polyangiaceae bacterium]|nr:outer membrane protein transport protein [Polyangiaceae bacterium]